MTEIKYKMDLIEPSLKANYLMTMIMYIIVKTNAHIWLAFGQILS